MFDLRICYKIQATLISQGSFGGSLLPKSLYILVRNLLVLTVFKMAHLGLNPPRSCFFEMLLVKKNIFLLMGNNVCRVFDVVSSPNE